jgi:glycosyltransferase involved in cell wall biosynthesis
LPHSVATLQQPAVGSEGAESALPLISVIVVTYNRAQLAARCIDSVLKQSAPSIEVIVVLNGASPAVVTAMRRRAGEDPRVRLLSCEKMSASEARNTAVTIARSELLYFLDDDVEVPLDGLNAVVELFRAQPRVAIAGGPNLTPPDDPPFAQLAGTLLASSFGSGIARPRYAAVESHATTEKHLTLCNLVVRREVFTGGTTLPSTWGGEENVLMGRAARLGHMLWYSPTLWVYHRRRFTWRDHMDQMRRYGFGRGIAIHFAPGTFHVAYFLPVGLLFYLLMLPALAATGSAWVLLPLGLYGALAVATSVSLAIRRGVWLNAPVLPALFLLTHLAYAVGLLKGLVRGAGNRLARSSPKPPCEERAAHIVSR